MKIVARQKLAGRLAPVGVGAFAVVVGVAALFFLSGPVWANVCLSIWFVLVGAVFIAAGIVSWCPNGIALAFVEQGIRWHYGSIKKPYVVIPWPDIDGVRVVTWPDEYGDQVDGVVLFLNEVAPNPLHHRHLEWLAKELRTRFGEPMPENVLLFTDEAWSWNAIEVAEEIHARISKRRGGIW